MAGARTRYGPVRPGVATIRPPGQGCLQSTARRREPLRRKLRHTAMTSSWRVLALLPLLAVAACGQGASGQRAAADDDALGAAPAAPDALVLQVVRVGGFLPPGAAFRSVPSVSVYGDGRVVSEGAQIEVWPAPALPSVQVGRLDPDEVGRLLDTGREVVEADEDYGQPPVADAPTTAVVVQDGGARSVAAAVALEELSGEPAPPASGGLTAEQRAARERRSAYVRQVQDAVSAVPAEAYDGEGLAVLAEPYGDAAPAAELPPTELAWPGPALSPGTCTVVAGEEATQVRSAAASASVETRWTAGGEVLRLAFRPLLPHERTCEDVQETVVPPSP